jgi:hypothetical protein
LEAGVAVRPIDTANVATTEGVSRLARSTDDFAKLYARLFRRGRVVNSVFNRVDLILSIWIIFLAVLFLVGALVWLSSPQGSGTRLPIVCGLIVALPLCLVIFLDVKHHEVLGITAA